MLNRFVSILVLSLITCGAFAADVDNCTLSECKQLRSRLDARIQKLQAGIAPTFGDIVRKDSSSEKYCSDVSDSGICYMTQQKAIDYCASQSQHLPSARELAQLSASLGAKGILAEAMNDSYPITAKNLDGTIDQFNFSYTGYKRPAGDLGNNWFWSSSVRPNLSYGTFYFSGGVGRVGSFNRSYDIAVRCVAGR